MEEKDKKRLCHDKAVSRKTIDEMDLLRDPGVKKYAVYHNVKMLNGFMNAACRDCSHKKFKTQEVVEPVYSRLMIDTVAHCDQVVCPDGYVKALGKKPELSMPITAGGGMGYAYDATRGTLTMKTAKDDYEFRRAEMIAEHKKETEALIAKLEKEREEVLRAHVHKAVTLKGRTEGVALGSVRYDANTNTASVLTEKGWMKLSDAEDARLRTTATFTTTVAPDSAKDKDKPKTVGADDIW